MADNDLQTEQMKLDLALKKELIVEYEQRIAVHPKHLDDRNKGRLCPNYRARAIFTRRRDELLHELEELVAELATRPDAEHPGNTEQSSVSPEKSDPVA